MVAQLFLVSRVMKYLDVKGALLIAPVIGLLGYGGIALAPSLGSARVAKTAENSNDYSLQSTLQKILFLPTSRAAKYSAQVAIGSVVVRLGDMASSGVTYLGSEKLGWSTRELRDRQSGPPRSVVRHRRSRSAARTRRARRPWESWRRRRERALEAQRVANISEARRRTAMMRAATVTRSARSRTPRSSVGLAIFSLPQPRSRRPLAASGVHVR